MKMIKPVKAFCINLWDRKQKMERALKLWSPFIEVKRHEAYDGRPEGNGILGCYNSHLEIAEQFQLEYPFGPEPNDPALFIIEDDAIPCKDFNTRLDLFWPELPDDCDIFMLGYWPMQNAEMHKVTEHIYKATKSVLATHCYVINPSFVKTFIDICKKSREKNLDAIFRYLQENHNVYIAMPSFSYQEGNWSDTVSTPTNYDGMKKYFKDTL